MTQQFFYRALVAGLAALSSASVWALAEPEAALRGAARTTFERSARPLAQPERARLLSAARAGQRVVAVGEMGTIVLSDDGGQHWRAASSVPTSASLTQVRFVDARLGWAVGHFGVVLRTVDGGERWSRVLDGERAAQVSLAAAQASGDAQRLRGAQTLVDEGADKPLLDLLLQGADDVTVVGAYNTAFRSTDGGATWKEAGTAGLNPKSLHLYGIARSGKSEWWVGEAGLVVRRDAEGGAHRITTPFPGTFNGALALDEQQVLLYGLRGRVMRSADGGQSWQSSQVPGEATINCAVLLSQRRIALGDQTGRVLLSEDGGATFRAVTPGGVPITSLVEAADGALVVTTLVGVTRLPSAQWTQR